MKETILNQFPAWSAHRAGSAAVFSSSLPASSFQLLFLRPIHHGGLNQRLELFQLGKDRGARLFVHDLLRILLESSGHGIGILTFEENQVAILPLRLEGGKVNAVLSGDTVERADILVCDLHALQAPILGGELFDGHFPMGLPGLMTGFHLGKKFVFPYYDTMAPKKWQHGFPALSYMALLSILRNHGEDYAISATTGMRVLSVAQWKEV